MVDVEIYILIFDWNGERYASSYLLRLRFWKLSEYSVSVVRVFHAQCSYPVLVLGMEVDTFLLPVHFLSVLEVILNGLVRARRRS